LTMTIYSKNLKQWPFLVLVALLSYSCSGNMDYDISEGFNKEFTLFEDEISVPVGSIGPLTVSSVMDRLGKTEGLGGIIAEFLKQDADGCFYIEDEGDIYKQNVYEIVKATEDVSVPFKWEAGSPYSGIGGLPMMLGIVGLKVMNQKVQLLYINPFRNVITIKSNASLSCKDSNWQDTYYVKLDEACDGVLTGYNNQEVLCERIIPADLTDMVSNISLDSLVLVIPANPASRLVDNTVNSVISISYAYQCGITLGETFQLSDISIDLDDLNLEIGKFRLSKGVVSVEISNTLPVAVTLNKLEVLDKTEEGEYIVNENIKFSEGIRIAGGSLANPATSTLQFEVAAASGTIPDIGALRVTVSIAAEPGLGPVALSARQGLYVKSSSAKLNGGITVTLK